MSGATIPAERILLDTKKREKGEEKGETQYVCDCCDYFTCDKSKYDRHLLTAKHKKEKKGEKGHTTTIKMRHFA